MQELELENIPQAIPRSYIDEIAKQLIDGADKMLYQAKKNGRSCAVTGEILKGIYSGIKPNKQEMKPVYPVLLRCIIFKVYSILNIFPAVSSIYIITLQSIRFIW
jgi:hypothetical protein